MLWLRLVASQIPIAHEGWLFSARAGVLIGDLLSNLSTEYHKMMVLL